MNASASATPRWGIARAQAKKDPITVRPADLLQPEWNTLSTDAAKLDGFDGTDTDVLTYAMFPGVAPGFFSTRAEGPKNVGKTEAQPKAGARGEVRFGQRGHRADQVQGQHGRARSQRHRREGVNDMAKPKNMTSGSKNCSRSGSPPEPAAARSASTSSIHRAS